MQELSLNVLDIAQNSIRAGADLITIRVEERTADHFMEISVSDNGCGMSEEQVARVKDPFFTTRTTRKVGLGVPLFRMSAESTGGSFDIESKLGVGTTTTARYFTDHLDMLPLGDMTATMTSLISVNPDLDFIYVRSVDDQSFTLDTRELRAVLEGVPLNTPDVLIFIRDMIDENTAALTV
ncbi:MAG: ATP-binding protein [Oscillospiraceae bacterium]|nr:ATP-binding protein [Oscillospiraceae bacterium]